MLSRMQFYWVISLIVAQGLTVALRMKLMKFKLMIGILGLLWLVVWPQFTP